MQTSNSSTTHLSSHQPQQHMTHSLQPTYIAHTTTDTLHSSYAAASSAASSTGARPVRSVLVSEVVDSQQMQLDEDEVDDENEAAHSDEDDQVNDEEADEDEANESMYALNSATTSPQWTTAAASSSSLIGLPDMDASSHVMAASSSSLTAAAVSSSRRSNRVDLKLKARAAMPTLRFDPPFLAPSLDDIRQLLQSHSDRKKSAILHQPSHTLTHSSFSTRDDTKMTDDEHERKSASEAADEDDDDESSEEEDLFPHLILPDRLFIMRERLSTQVRKSLQARRYRQTAMKEKRRLLAAHKDLEQQLKQDSIEPADDNKVKPNNHHGSSSSSKKKKKPLNEEKSESSASKNQSKKVSTGEDDEGNAASESNSSSPSSSASTSESESENENEMTVDVIDENADFVMPAGLDRAGRIAAVKANEFCRMKLQASMELEDRQSHDRLVQDAMNQTYGFCDSNPRSMVLSRDSVLIKLDLCDIINPGVMHLFSEQQVETLRNLLPECDRSENGLNTTFATPHFMQSLYEYQELLTSGSLDPDMREMRNVVSARRRRECCDVWKKNHFERYWGEAYASKGVRSEDKASRNKGPSTVYWKPEKLKKEFHERQWTERLLKRTMEGDVFAARTRKKILMQENRWPLPPVTILQKQLASRLKDNHNPSSVLQAAANIAIQYATATSTPIPSFPTPNTIAAAAAAASSSSSSADEQEKENTTGNSSSNKKKKPTSSSTAASIPTDISLVSHSKLKIRVDTKSGQHTLLPRSKKSKPLVPLTSATAAATTATGATDSVIPSSSSSSSKKKKPSTAAAHPSDNTDSTAAAAASSTTSSINPPSVKKKAAVVIGPDGNPLPTASSRKKKPSTAIPLLNADGTPVIKQETIIVDGQEVQVAKPVTVRKKPTPKPKPAAVIAAVASDVEDGSLTAHSNANPSSSLEQAMDDALFQSIVRKKDGTPDQMNTQQQQQQQQQPIAAVATMINADGSTSIVAQPTVAAALIQVTPPVKATKPRKKREPQEPVMQQVIGPGGIVTMVPVEPPKKKKKISVPPQQQQQQQQQFQTQQSSMVATVMGATSGSDSHALLAQQHQQLQQQQAQMHQAQVAHYASMQQQQQQASYPSPDNLAYANHLQMMQQQRQQEQMQAAYFAQQLQQQRQLQQQQQAQPQHQSKGDLFQYLSAELDESERTPVGAEAAMLIDEFDHRRDPSTLIALAHKFSAVPALAAAYSHQKQLRDKLKKLQDDAAQVLQQRQLAAAAAAPQPITQPIAPSISMPQQSYSVVSYSPAAYATQQQQQQQLQSHAVGGPQ